MKLLLLAASLAALSGCAAPRLASEFPRTDQRLTAPVPPGHSRVVVFNSSNSLLYGIDGSGRMEVLIDSRALGSLDPGEYAQVFLPPGRHDVALRRRDMMWFETEHPFLIDRPARYLNIAGVSGGNQLVPLDDPPADFARKYQPAR